MTQNVLQSVLSENEPYKVRGIRDGLLFRFDLKSEPDAQKQSATACAAVAEKVPALAQLLGENAVVEIEGAAIGEMDRLRLEQSIGAALGRQICVRLRDLREIPAENTARTHIGTVRGGMHIKADGDLTVIGDVHTGARLEAGGNIVVLGVVSGAIWAGQSGDTRAIAAAWKMMPSEIRIADVQSQKPCASYAPHGVPECACLCNGEILIKKYADRI